MVIKPILKPLLMPEGNKYFTISRISNYIKFKASIKRSGVNCTYSMPRLPYFTLKH